MKIIPSVIVFLVLGIILSGLVDIPFADAANANLFVSAENSQFQNYFAGPMVIEVVVIDNTINDIGTPQPEPDVTINGKNLRMVQATDGNWYAYFVDKTMAQRADQTVGLEGRSLDFGKFCSNVSNGLGTSFSETVGVAVPRLLLSGTDGMNAFQQCNKGPSNTTPINHVVREPRTINTNVNSTGQIGLNQFAWPIIQLYDFNPMGNVVVQYNKGGGVQSTTLTFDTVNQFVSIGVDRNEYPKGSQVHAVITDPQLNIDPTDEDSWTWATTISNQKTLYQLFDENGNADSDGTSGAVDLLGVLSSMMFEDNGVLGLEPKKPTDATFTINLVDNNDQRLLQGSDITQARTEGNSLISGTQPMTLTETGPATGVFVNSDEVNNTNLIVTMDAQDGSFATIHYNDKALVIQVENLQMTPNPPSVSVFSISSSQIDLSWNVSTGATSYVIERSAMSAVSGFTQINTTTNTSYSDVGLQPNTTYYYRVYASNVHGTSAPSLVSTTTLNQSPPPPILTPDANKRPTAQISAPNTSTTGNQITFSASGSFDPDGVIEVYKWNFDDGNSGSGETVTHTYQQEGEYSVILTVVDNKKAADTQIHPIKISLTNQLPKAVIDGQTKTEIGSTITLSASKSSDPDGGKIVKYQWELADGTILDGPQIDLTYPSIGQHFVKLIITDDEGTVGEETIPITITEKESSESDGNTLIYVLGGAGAAAIIGTVAYFAKTHFGTKKDDPLPSVNCWIEIHGGLDNE